MVTVDSPDLVGDRALLTKGVNDVVSPLSSIEDSFLVVARLGCMNALRDSLDGFKNQIESAIRQHLIAALSFSHLFSAISLWFGFATFCRRLTNDVHPGLRDALLVEYMLEHLTVQQMFDPSMSWHRMRSLSAEQLKLMGDRFGGQAEFGRFLQSIYLNQRRALAQELVLKSLPTLVLVVSSLIAVVLALVFTRSLTFGQ